MKAVVCVCILAPLMLFSSINVETVRQAATVTRGEYTSAPLPEVGGRRFSVVIPKGWQAANLFTRPDSPLSQWHFDLVNQSGKVAETVRISLIADPVLRRRSWVGSLARGESFTTLQGFHGDILGGLIATDGKPTETTTRLYFIGDNLYPDGILCCDITFDNVTEDEKARFARYVFSNLRWEK